MAPPQAQVPQGRGEARGQQVGSSRDRSDRFDVHRMNGEESCGHEGRALATEAIRDLVHQQNVDGMEQQVGEGITEGLEPKEPVVQGEAIERNRSVPLETVRRKRRAREEEGWLERLKGRVV